MFQDIYFWDLDTFSEATLQSMAGSKATLHYNTYNSNLEERTCVQVHVYCIFEKCRYHVPTYENEFKMQLVVALLNELTLKLKVLKWFTCYNVKRWTIAQLLGVHCQLHYLEK